MSAHVTDLNGSTFDETIQGSSKPVVVDFWAEWCGPCKAVAPIIDEIAQEYPDDLAVTKLNIDENPDVAVKYNVLSIPTVLVFKDGEVVKSITGARPKAALLEEFSEFLPSH